MFKLSIDSEKKDNGNGQIEPSNEGEDTVRRSNAGNIFTLDGAIEEAKMGKYQYFLTFLTGLSIMGSAIENTNVSYILAYAKCDLEITTSEQGLLSAISYLGIVFTSHLWGFLADTWGRKKVIRVAAIGGFVASFLSAFSINTLNLLILRFFAGAFVAGATSAGFSYISEFHTTKVAPRAASFVTTALMSVWVLMSPLAMVIIPMDWTLHLGIFEYTPWRLFLTCTTFINLWNAIAFSFLPESPKFLLAMNRKEEALEILSRVYAINTGQPKEKYPVKDIESVSLGNELSSAKSVWSFFNLVVIQTKPVFQRPLLTNTWKLCYIIFALFGIGNGSFVWFPNFLTQLLQYNGAPKTLCEIVGPSVAANDTNQKCDVDNKDLTPFLLLFAVGICFFAFALASSFLMKKIEPKKLVCGWLAASVIACIVLVFITNSYTITVVYVVFVSCNVVANVVMAVAVNLYPTINRAMATALIMMCGRVGSVGGSSLIGILLEDNCTLIFYLYGGILISCALVFLLIKNKS